MFLKKVVILYGCGDESLPDFQDTRIQVEELAAVLRHMGIAVCLLDYDLPEPQRRARMQQENPDLVLNRVEAVEGEEKRYFEAAEWLEVQGCIYTGNRAHVLFLANEKMRLKKVLRRAGIQTPAAISADDMSAPNAMASYIVKSLDSHGSKGIDEKSVVHSVEAASRLMQEKAAEYGGGWFAEEYIEGREINLAIIEDGDDVLFLPATETRFDNLPPDRPRIVGYDAKWDEQSEAYQTPISHLDEQDNALYATLCHIGKEVWHRLDLRGMARIDFRIDAQGAAWLIDLNPLPSLRSNSYVVSAAEKAGISQQGIVQYLLKSAQKKKRISWRGCLQPDDIEALGNLVEKTHVFSGEEKEVACQLARENIEKGEQASGYFFEVAEVEGKIVGYSCFGLLELTRSSYGLYWLVVDPTRHGQGLAQALLKRTEEKIMRLGGSQIFAETSGTPLYAPARHFYEKENFSEMGRLPDFYKPDDAKYIYGKKI